MICASPKPAAMSNQRSLKLRSAEWYCGAPKVVRPPDLSLTGAGGRRAAGEAGGEAAGGSGGQGVQVVAVCFCEAAC